MADAPARRDHVVSKDSFFPRPDAEYRRPRTLIQGIRLKFHTDAAERFKRMP
jgi:hypothetical protein